MFQEKALLSNEKQLEVPEKRGGKRQPSTNGSMRGAP
jgi:hypothetical protein